jgi:hypothetical protein
MVLRSSQKPNSCFLAAQMIRAIEFCELTDAPSTYFESKSWIAPDFLLAMRKGDIKAHCLLFCRWASLPAARSGSGFAWD